MKCISSKVVHDSFKKLVSMLVFAEVVVITIIIVIVLFVVVMINVEFVGNFVGEYVEYVTNAFVCEADRDVFSFADAAVVVDVHLVEEALGVGLYVVSGGGGVFTCVFVAILASILASILSVTTMTMVMLFGS